MSIARIDGPGIVRRRNVQNSVDFQNRALDRNSGELAFSFTTNGGLYVDGTARPAIQPR
jgi:hypothetical protein